MEYLNPQNPEIHWFLTRGQLLNSEFTTQELIPGWLFVKHVHAKPVRDGVAGETRFEGVLVALLGHVILFGYLLDIRCRIT